jgi:hypothetical protein
VIVKFGWSAAVGESAQRPLDHAEAQHVNWPRFVRNSGSVSFPSLRGGDPLGADLRTSSGEPGATLSCNVIHVLIRALALARSSGTEFVKLYYAKRHFLEELHLALDWHRPGSQDFETFGAARHARHRSAMPLTSWRSASRSACNSREDLLGSVEFLEFPTCQKSVLKGAD